MTYVTLRSVLCFAALITTLRSKHSPTTTGTGTATKVTATMEVPHPMAQFGFSLRLGCKAGGKLRVRGVLGQSQTAPMAHPIKTLTK